jgi:hypothetical protein
MTPHATHALMHRIARNKQHSRYIKSTLFDSESRLATAAAEASSCYCSRHCCALGTVARGCRVVGGCWNISITNRTQIWRRVAAVPSGVCACRRMISAQRGLHSSSLPALAPF